MSDAESSETNPWRRQLYTLREAITETLVDISQSYPAEQSVFASRAHKQLHNLIFEYRDLAAPYAGELETPSDDPSLWDEPLRKVTLPAEYTETVVNGNAAEVLATGDKHDILDAFFSRVDTTEATVTLSNIDRLFKNSAATLRVSGWVSNSGNVTRSVQQSLYTPVAVCRDARNQLDKCFVEFGWLPDVESTPRTEITKEDMEKVLEWRERNLNE